MIRTASAPRRSPGGRRAFTLVEIMVCISIMAILLAAGTGSLAQQIAFSRARTAAERLCAALQHAQAMARTLRIAGASRYGVVIWPKRRVLNTEGDCFSFLVVRNLDPDQPVPIPPLGTNQAAINANSAWRAGQLRLTPDTELYANWVPGVGGGAEIGEIRIFFNNDGTLDLANSSANNGQPLTVALPNVAAPATVGAIPGGQTFTFDIVNQAFGYIRVRLRANGSVERSGYTRLNGTPQSRLGAAF